MLRRWSFRGSYQNRGNGMQRHASDVEGLCKKDAVLRHGKNGVPAEAGFGGEEEAPRSTDEEKPAAKSDWFF